MTLIEKIHRINRLHDLIKRKATGTPKELARKFEVSERCAYRMIEELRSMNLDIVYCRSINSYKYKTQVDFSLSIIRNRDSSGQINDLICLW